MLAAQYLSMFGICLKSNLKNLYFEVFNIDLWSFFNIRLNVWNTGFNFDIDIF